MKDSFILSVLGGRIPLFLILWNSLVRCKKNILLFLKGSFADVFPSVEGARYGIASSSFSQKGRKHGISGVARLLNSEEFLEVSILSHLPFFDEIILVDNGSTDNTYEICLSLKKRYPDKVKVYRYPKISSLGKAEFDRIDNNDFRCISYYYNRCFSKTSYSRVAKIDDDHLLIPSIMKKNRELILHDRTLKTYYQMLGLNVLDVGKGNYVIPKMSPFMGLFGDHGFFPISSKTYFVKDKKMENFLHDLSVVYLPISFIHLKYLKKDSGETNYGTDYNIFSKKNRSGPFSTVPIPKELLEELNALYL